MSNEVQKQRVKQIQNIALKEMNQEIDQAYNDLFKTDKSNYQLPEHVFVNNFLPYFSGQVKEDKNLPVTTTWIAIAGTPMNPVDIVDETGEVLYTVPPLMSSNFLRTNENLRGKSFNEIFTRARNQANRLPVLGDRVLAEEASQKLNKMDVKPSIEEYSNWNNIYERYGIKTASKLTNKNNNKQNQDDELEFG